MPHLDNFKSEFQKNKKIKKVIKKIKIKDCCHI